VDPAEVDVNIHPAKREVKFRRENRVRSLVTQAVRQSLLAPHGSSQTQPSQPPHSLPVDYPRLDRLPTANAPTATAAPQWAPSEPAGSIMPPIEQNQILPGIIHSPVLSLESSPPAAPPTPTTAITATLHQTEDHHAAPHSPPASTSPTSPASPATIFSLPLRMIGVLGRLYVLFESDRGLVLLDQHAAHERVLFEQMLRQLEQGTAPSQRLLLAQTIELPPRDAQFLRENLAVLARLGVGLSEFGDRTFLLDALPPYVEGGNPREFILEVLAELKAAGEGVNPLRLGENAVATTVCRHAVKAHDPLSATELEKLLEQLRQCEMPYTCPHGRPTLIEIAYRELEKKFGRIQPG